MAEELRVFGANVERRDLAAELPGTGVDDHIAAGLRGGHGGDSWRGL
jgi:hypothetical protein